MNSTLKTALLWVVIIVLVFLLWSLFQTTKGTSELIPFSAFLDKVNQSYVEKVVIRDDEIHGETKPNAPGGKREWQRGIVEAVEGDRVGVRAGEELQWGPADAWTPCY